nr:MAG TPA: hypothetical protein [Caudoviricetes sp.]
MIDRGAELIERLFDWQWMVTMKYKWTLTQKDYEEKGVSIYGDEEQYMQALDDMVHTTRSIADLAELHDEGKDFIIRMPGDTEKIFTIIHEYTSYVASQFNTSIYITPDTIYNNPKLRQLIDDVVKLQNLGNAVYPVMTTVVKHTAETEGLLGFINKTSGRSFVRRLDFNPVERYGFRAWEIGAGRDKYPTKDEQVIDIRKQFDPHTINQLGGYI